MKMKSLAESLTKTSNELLVAHDLRDWNRLEQVLSQHFQLFGADNDKAGIAAGYATQAFRECKNMVDDLSNEKITIDELKTNKVIINGRSLPRIGLKVYYFHSKTLETLEESSNSAYHHTMWWLQNQLGKKGEILPNLRMTWHLYELQRQKYGIITATKVMPNLIKITRAHRSKDEEKQTKEFMKYWTKILSSGSKAVMY